MLYKFPPFQELKDNFTLLITNDCNLNCSYCFEKNVHNNYNMDISIAKKCIDYIFDKMISHTNKLGILLLGGEPLLKIELLEQIINYTISKNSQIKKWEDIVFYFSTNGTLFHSLKVKNFIEKYQEYLCVAFSLDGNKTIQDLNRSNSFDIVINNFNYWHKIFPDNVIIMTINPVSVKYLFDSIKYLLSLNIKYIETDIVYEDNWDCLHKQELKKQMILVADYIIKNKIYEHVNILFFSSYFLMENELRHCDCSNGLYKYVFDYKGNIYPCLRFAFIKNPLVIGNIFNKKIDYKKILPLLFTNKKLQCKCSKCKYYKVCEVCLAIIYDKTNSIFNMNDDICDIIKNIYEANEYYWNKLLQDINIDKQDFISKIRNGYFI